LYNFYKFKTQGSRNRRWLRKNLLISKKESIQQGGLKDFPSGSRIEVNAIYLFLARYVVTQSNNLIEARHVKPLAREQKIILTTSSIQTN